MIKKPLYVDVHVLQTVPPSCINRDDTGSPKTARFGGVRRARVSSQAWKKAMRDEFALYLDESEIGLRTKSVIDLISGYVKDELPQASDEDAVSMACAALKATGIAVKDGNETGYLLFISRLQARALAHLVVAANESGDKISAKDAKAILNPKERPELNAIDIALFGRMVADAPILNVDAAAQVAHAIGIGEANAEFDYYTAMDDLSQEDESGAGMIGTVEFLSATFYRYATLDVYHLFENLGSAKVTKKAVEAYIRSFVQSMPTGKQNTFANRTVPSAVVIQLRDTQPVSLVNAFEIPVRAGGNRSTIGVASERIVAQEKSIDDAFGLAPIATYVVCATSEAEALTELSGNAMSLSEAISAAEEEVESYLRGRGADTESQG